MALQLSYFYGREAEQYSFFRIPKALFTDERYKPLSMESKMLYGLMLDRMALSVKSGWLDDNNRVYIFFTLDDAIETMGYGHNKVVRLFKELEEIGLIERKKQGLCKPTIVYVKNFISAKGPSEPCHTKEIPTQLAPEPPACRRKTEAPSDFPMAEVLTSEARNPGLPETGIPDFPKSEVQTAQNGNPGFPEIGTPDFPKREAIKTESIKTEMNDTDSINPPSSPARFSRSQPPLSLMDSMDRMESYREQIRENIDYDLLCEQHPFDVETIDGYVDLMVEVCCTSCQTVRVCGNNTATGVVKQRYLSLNHDHIAYVLDRMNNNTAPIKNIKAYMLTALYNAPSTMPQFYASLVNYDLDSERGA